MRRLIDKSEAIKSLDPTAQFIVYDGTSVEWFTTPMSDEVIDAEVTRMEAEKPWINLREQRNHLLAETDFHALSDVTMSPEVAEYRKLLRDLPETVDIDNPVFPDKP
jgi:hypothetical protein